jgi:hypothetical protein
MSTQIWVLDARLSDKFHVAAKPMNDMEKELGFQAFRPSSSQDLNRTKSVSTGLFLADRMTRK